MQENIDFIEDPLLPEEKLDGPEGEVQENPTYKYSAALRRAMFWQGMD